jgi:toxin ParE1/3/4
MVDLIWKSRAIKKLDEIGQYISKDSKEQANKIIKDIVKTAISLKKLPNRGRIVPELHISSIREIFYKKWRIIYQLTNDSIIILTVLHQNQLFRI